VKDGSGQKLAYVYYEDEPGRRSVAKLLTKGRGAADRGQYRQVAGVVRSKIKLRRRLRLSLPAPAEQT
jgi:hypothetical protein